MPWISTAASSAPATVSVTVPEGLSATTAKPGAEYRPGNPAAKFVAGPYG